MEIKYTKRNNEITIYIYGELDEYSAVDCKKMLDQLIMENINVEKVVFDLSGISFMDSTGIGLLIGRYKKLKRFNVESYITGASLSTEKVLELAGIYKIMPKY